MNSALKAVADQLAVIAPDIKDGSGKALEGLVLFSLAAALEDQGATVSARDHASQELSGSFILRGSPGHLVDPNASGLQPTFFAAEFYDQIFELHNSLEFVGTSETEHEMDISAVWRADAEAARAKPKRMIAAPPAVGVELKEVAASATLDKNVIRAFFACIVDLVPTWPVEVMFMGRSGSMRLFVATHRSPDQFWVLTSAGISKPSKAFAGAYDIQILDHADPAKIATAAEAMAQRLAGLASSEPTRLAPLPPSQPPGTSASDFFRVRRGPLIKRIKNPGPDDF